MKKLDNKGWGLVSMICFICVFIIFLLVIAYFVWDLNKKGITQNSEQTFIVLKP